MQMDMKDALSRVRPYIPDQPISRGGDSLFARDLVRGAYQRGKQGAIFRLSRVDAGDMGAWNDQRMQRRLGIHVAERNDIVGRVHDLRGSLPVSDATEQTGVAPLSSHEHSILPTGNEQVTWCVQSVA